MAHKLEIEFDSEADTPLRKVRGCADRSAQPQQPAKSPHKLQPIGAARIRIAKAIFLFRHASDQNK